jgi:hypothetical protein
MREIRLGLNVSGLPASVASFKVPKGVPSLQKHAWKGMASDSRKPLLDRGMNSGGRPPALPSSVMPASKPLRAASGRFGQEDGAAYDPGPRKMYTPPP